MGAAGPVFASSVRHKPKTRLTSNSNTEGAENQYADL